VGGRAPYGAALIGVIGGVAGALLGTLIGNSNANNIAHEQIVASQQASERAERRIDYTTFLGIETRINLELHALAVYEASNQPSVQMNLLSRLDSDNIASSDALAAIEIDATNQDIAGLAIVVDNSLTAEIDALNPAPPDPRGALESRNAAFLANIQAFIDAVKKDIGTAGRP
jgi:hypothetical protein